MNNGVLASKVVIAQLVCLWDRASNPTWVFFLFPSPMKLSLPQLMSFLIFVPLVLSQWNLNAQGKKWSCEHVTVNTVSWDIVPATRLELSQFLRHIDTDTFSLIWHLLFCSCRYEMSH